MSTASSVVATLLVATFGASVVAPATHAQATPPTPLDEQRRAAAAATMSTLVSKTAEEMAEAQLRIVDRPETAERIAAFKKNLFDALRQKGFTVEQAMAITVATAMPPFAGR